MSYKTSILDELPEEVSVYEDVDKMIIENPGKIIHISFNSEGMCSRCYQTYHKKMENRWQDGTIKSIRKRSRDLYIILKKTNQDKDDVDVSQGGKE